MKRLFLLLFALLPMLVLAQWREPIGYDRIYKLSDGIAIVKLNGKYGLIETSGKVIVPPEYKEIKRVAYDKYLLTSNGLSIADSKGNIVHNVMIYTSSDGQVVSPRNDFDANIVSNTYSDGVGVIVFNKPVTEIGEYAFSDCTSLTSIIIPNSVTSIGEEAFRDCTSLTSITIPNSVTWIGYNPFRGCTALPVIDGIRYADTYLVEAVDKTRTSYTIKPGTRLIGSAFSGCTSLTSIIIPNGVTSIGDEAFRDCTSLTSITIPNSVTSIGEWCFGESSLKEVYISDLSAWCKITYNTTSPYNGSMSNPCNNGAKLYLNGELLEELVIPSDIKELGWDSFVGCSSIKNIIFPEGFTSIGVRAFARCNNLINIIIPNSVRDIGARAFAGCDNLRSVTIGSGVTTIWAGAFIGCKNLQSIYCKASTPPTIDLMWAGAWNTPHPLEDHAPGRTIYVPRASVEAYKQAEYWNDYANDIVGYDF